MLLKINLAVIQKFLDQIVPAHQAGEQMPPESQESIRETIKGLHAIGTELQPILAKQQPSMVQDRLVKDLEANQAKITCKFPQQDFAKKNESVVSVNLGAYSFDLRIKHDDLFSRNSLQVEELNVDLDASEEDPFSSIDSPRMRFVSNMNDDTGNYSEKHFIGEKLNLVLNQALNHIADQLPAQYLSNLIMRGKTISANKFFNKLLHAEGLAHNAALPKTELSTYDYLTQAFNSFDPQVIINKPKINNLILKILGEKAYPWVIKDDLLKVLPKDKLLESFKVLLKQRNLFQKDIYATAECVSDEISTDRIYSDQVNELIETAKNVFGEESAEFKDLIAACASACLLPLNYFQANHPFVKILGGEEKACEALWKYLGYSSIPELKEISTLLKGLNVETYIPQEWREFQLKLQRLSC